MGGMVALAVAANHPGAASRFIVVAGSAGSPESDPPGSEVVSLVLSGNTTLLDALALGYPLDTAQGGRAWDTTGWGWARRRGAARRGCWVAG